MSKWKQWLDGQFDLSAALLKEPEKPLDPPVYYTPKPQRDVAISIIHHSRTLYYGVVAILCLLMTLFLILAVANLPSYGDPNAPPVNEVAQRYVEQGTSETGAVNTVAGMILDYRAFDTLGESFVLFTAMASVAILMSLSGRHTRMKKQPHIVDYYHNPIIKTLCKLVIPIILVFGIYVLCNGHLSPGGGFSGGAILSSALIIYALVWGDDRASRALPAKTIRIVVVISLAFYALSKTYSFYTGANHLPSIISPGTPGRILSAGLILPLNIAVGIVVCCTMYSFYMYFRRGSL